MPTGSNLDRPGAVEAGTANQPAALPGRQSARASVPHAVLAAVTDQQCPSAYQRHLADRIRTLGLDATLLTRFDPGVRTLLGHPALQAVVVPSRSEPFGRVPLEAYAAGATPVVATTAGEVGGTGHRRRDRIHRDAG